MNGTRTKDLLDWSYGLVTNTAGKNQWQQSRQLDAGDSHEDNMMRDKRKARQDHKTKKKKT